MKAEVLNIDSSDEAEGTDDDDIFMLDESGKFTRVGTVPVPVSKLAVKKEVTDTVRLIFLFFSVSYLMYL